MEETGNNYGDIELSEYMMIGIAFTQAKVTARGRHHGDSGTDD